MIYLIYPVPHSSFYPTILRLISPKIATLREMTSNFHKLDKFEGVGFRRWQKKMHFLLTTLKVVYVLNTPYPIEAKAETLDQARCRSKFENDDYIYRGHILNSMSDALFDVYQGM